MNFFNYDIPEEMKNYLSYYGMNFSPKLYKFAVDNMLREDATGKVEKVKPMSVDEFKALKEKYKMSIDSNDFYNAMYIASMVKADFYGSSIEDEEHLAKYVEDVICDVDAAEGQVFARYLADCMVRGCVILWNEMI